jgi:glycosyltransferase involved in cell wall biosynthesis
MQFPSGPKIVSVIIPCLNEEEAIGSVVQELWAQQVDEILVVDNGSADATFAKASAAGARTVSQPIKGYGLACVTGLQNVRSDAEIVCFLDGDGSDVPGYLRAIVTPIAEDDADFVMGSRIRGKRERGSMTAQQIIAGRLAGVLLKLVYGVRFSDMSPFRAMRKNRLLALGMTETTFGWNLEMQMRVASGRMRILEIPVDHRCRRGGVSKVSGNLIAGLQAASKITSTFLRLAFSLRASAPAKASSLPSAGHTGRKADQR